MSNPKFAVGKLVITINAQHSLHPEDVAKALARHVSGDWGELDEHDRRENELSLAQGYRLLSAYTDCNRVTFWIITEADRSVTNVELHISHLMWSSFEC